MPRAIELVDLPEKIAALVSQAFVCKGDDAPVDDFTLSCLIKDLLDEYDPEIVRRNTRKGEKLVKRLARR
ncbi:MAG TPA: hypothetical protein VJX67_21000 [Blastocatellia bacterium]|nr:hypothetical protein [Blastocatellia bacterium]